ncbi:TPR repeat-containing protein [Magnetococcus marinus MC-1]|uniref:protein O-GlcNAc transferase n=1 Tax=Magnetococcus marinus (strain ATCC BAA-1437 / JCM 17883 / MC-1) TaxID=156889 RepID=A0LCR6_MAGMM|nr:tetratricopeptide repeat protein [Magnetococcus marinus]ABK45759.1 TPR repeat-containing protein [Magnetococcus marinus MC-1]
MTLEEAFRQAAQWQQEGLLEQAEALYGQILQVAPEHPVVRYHMALISQQRGDQGPLEERLQAVLAVAPEHHDSHRLLGMLYTEQQQLERGAYHFEQALKGADQPLTLSVNYGYNLLRQERLQEAQQWFERALAQQPMDGAWDGLAKVARARGDLEAANDAYKQARALNPASINHLYNHALLLNQMEQHEQAEALFLTVLAQRPRMAVAHNGYGVLLRKTKRHPQAQHHFERALQEDATLVAAHNNLANTLVDMGQADAAIAHFRAALALEENREIRSNMLMALSYSSHYRGEDLYQELRVWNKHHGGGETTPSFPNDADPQRRLRVGYLSGDLCQHPLGFFTLPLLQNHDKQAVESFVYANIPKQDWLTEACRQQVDHWYDLAGQPDGVVAQQIAQDQIDVLVDLSGHTRGNLIGLLVKRSAPVQLLGGGCYCSNGIDTMDGVLADAYQVPDALASTFSEPLIRLHGYLNTVYAPPPYLPPVAPLPALEKGHITFGCCNNLAKFNPAVVALWSTLLKRLPHAKLLLRTFALNGAETRAWVCQQFAQHGIEAQRLVLHGGVSHEQLLQGYGEMDIALDPFPYSGGLTTVEALWMGVPVVALHGDRMAGRHSVGYLNCVGLGAWAVKNEQAYVEHAVAMAQDLAGLAALRQALRGRMEASPVADGAGYTRMVEGVYRTLWQRWCQSRTRVKPTVM